MAKTIAAIAQERAKKELGIFHFLYLADAIFENAINAVGNPGQAFIITELKEKSLDPMIKLIVGSSKQPGKGFFRSLFLVCIGSEKYDAITKIIDEMIILLIEAWDDSTLNDDRQKVKLFLKTRKEDYATNVPNPQAQMWAMRAKMVRGLI
jgi:hypothetical protein